jgi:hypothetical protein
VFNNSQSALSILPATELAVKSPRGIGVSVIVSPSEMTDPKPERRSDRRVPATIPATVKSKQSSQQLTAVTRDLNATGVFLYTDQQIAEGSKLEIVLILPEELGLGEKKWACCEASVVRVEDNGGSKFGVAATIERLDVLPEIPT